MRFCVEHKKVLETRKDWIGSTPEQHCEHFGLKLIGETKRYLEYRKYLVESKETKEKELFFNKHFGLILGKL